MASDSGDIPSGSLLIRQSASAVGEVAGRFIRTRDPLETLLDLQLPPTFAASLGAALEGAGFHVKRAEVRDPYSGTPRAITVATDGAVEIYVAHIPQWILVEATQANLAAVGYLQPAFVLAQPLFLLSEDCDAPLLPFSELIKGWVHSGVQATFVPWIHVRDFAAKNPDDQAFVLRTIFDVDLNGAPAATSVSIDDLSSEEVDAVVMALSRKASVAPAGATPYLTNFVRELALPQDWAAEVADPWTGDANADARALVTWAFSKGRYPPTSEKHAWFVAGEIAWRLAKDDYGPGGKVLVRIILAHRLALDGEVLRTLRERLEEADD